MKLNIPCFPTNKRVSHVVTLSLVADQHLIAELVTRVSRVGVGVGGGAHAGQGVGTLELADEVAEVLFRVGLDAAEEGADERAEGEEAGERERVAEVDHGVVGARPQLDGHALEAAGAAAAAVGRGAAGEVVAVHRHHHVQGQVAGHN